jgi:hypothetical protein
MKDLESVVKKESKAVPWWKKALVTGSLIATTIIAAACSPTDFKKGNECTYDSDCQNSALECDDGLCYFDNGDLFCLDDLDCNSGDNCDNYVCNGNDQEPIIERTMSGVRISEGVSDSNGVIKFQDPGEVVTINVQDNNGNKVSGAKGIYFDGMNDFKCYFVSSTDGSFSSSPVCYDHNSSHTISVTPAPLSFGSHRNVSSEASDQAANKFMDWTDSNWKGYGCRDKEQLEGLMKGGQVIASTTSSIFSLGTLSTVTNQLGDKLVQELGDDVSGEVYGFIPSEHGFRATTSLWTVVLKSEGCEVVTDCLPEHAYIACHNGDVWYVDNCQALNDKKEDCANGCENDRCIDIACEPTFDWKVCYGDDIREEDNCGNISSVIFTCSGNTHCDDGKCVTDTVGCEDECNTEGELSCNGDRVIGCDTGGDGCLDRVVVENCGSDEYCSNGRCVNDPPVCQDDCSNEGEVFCDGNYVIRCEEWVDGCLDGMVIESCGDNGGTCIGGECQSMDAEWFQDLGNGTVLDEHTGDVWLKSSPGARSYGDANRYCNDLNIAGSTNWRLPTKEELKILRLDNKQSNGLYLSPAFSPIDAAWTSEECLTSMGDYTKIIEFNNPNDYTFDNTCLREELPSHPKCIKDD